MKILFSEERQLYELEFDENVLSNPLAYDNLLKLISKVTGEASPAPLDKIINEPPIELKEYEEIVKSIPVKEYERFPNDLSTIKAKDKGNLIDINNMNVVKPIRYNYFRCPDCGQAHFIKVHDLNGETLIVRDLEHKKSLYKVLSEINFNEYKYGDPIDVEGERLSLVCGEDIYGECPFCEYNDKLEYFINAFEYPSEHFTLNNICPACGNEMLLDISQEGQKYSCEVCTYEVIKKEE